MTLLEPKTTLDALQKKGLLSQRAYNCLFRAKLRTLGDIKEFVDQGNELRKIPNVGIQVEREIKSLVSRCKDIPKKEDKKDKNIPISPLKYEDLEPKMKEILEMAFNNVSFPESVQPYLTVSYPEVKNVCNMLGQGKNAILRIQPALTREENIEYRHWHIDLLEEVLQLMKERQMEAEPRYMQLTALREVLLAEYQRFSLAEIVSHYIPQEVDQRLQQCYEDLGKKHLSIRGSNFMKAFVPNYKDVVGYFGKPFEDFNAMCLGHTMKKTLSEIYNLVQLFQQQGFDNLERYLDEDDGFLNHLKNTYPYLNHAECVFVGIHIRQYGVRPVLYMMNQLIRTIPRKEIVCYCLNHGVYDGIEHTLRQIAQALDVRIWDIELSLRNRLSFLTDAQVTEEEKIYYSRLLKENVITEDSELFTTLVQEEQLPKRFGLFCALYTFLSDYEIFNHQGYKALVSPALKPHLNFKHLIDKFNKACTGKYTSAAFLPFSHFTGEIPKEFNKDIATLLRLIVRDKPNKQDISITEKGVVFLQNKVDIPEALYNLLKEAGEPLTLKELFDRFVEIYPNHKIYQVDQLRQYINPSEKIKSVGNTGRLGLKEWKEVYFGTIKSLLLQTLLQSDRPLKIEEVLEKVRKHVPSTNIKDLTATIQSDTSGRFVQFEGGYFGLRTKKYFGKFKRK